MESIPETKNEPEKEKESVEDKKLNCTWTFWYASRKEKDRHIPYEQRLIEIFSFSTLKEFFNRFMYIKDIESIPRNNEIAIFKKGYKPLWENTPESAFWFYRFHPEDDKFINIKWEQLIFSLIGEQFEEPNILGVVLSKRGRETIIELWFNYFGFNNIKNKLETKFRNLIGLEYEDALFFKENKKSCKDKSSLRNAEAYGHKKRRKFTFN